MYLSSEYVYKTIASKTTVHGWERAGKFPRRIYLSPRKVVWKKAEIDAWLADRAQQDDVMRAKAGATGAGLVSARREKADRHLKGEA
jgi:predicted DNA-binding transcriptional regulator AlpA